VLETKVEVDEMADGGAGNTGSSKAAGDTAR
jgi:hypothetical protein